MESIEIQGKRFYNVDTLVELLNDRCSPQTIRKMLKDGALSGGKKLGRYWYVPETSVLNYLQGV